jgi:hypothetical protein
MAFNQKRSLEAGRILFCDSGLAVGEVGPLCVAIWRKEVTHARFLRQKGGLGEVVAAHPNGCGFICIIEPSAKPPSEELRRASIQMVTGHADKLRCLAVVIEGQGFGAAVTRSVISGMSVLLPRALTGSAFAEVPKAIAWMTEHVRIDLPTKVAFFVQALRVEMDSANPTPPAGTNV